MEPANVLKSHLINKRFKVENKIDQGTYGTVFLGTDQLTKKKVAIKVESVDAPGQTLRNESEMYKHIKYFNGFPSVLYTGQAKGFNIIVMEMLGVSLKHVIEELNQSFTLKTVLQIADQMLLRLQTLHGLNIIHCDLKPSNLMMGCGDKSDQLYLIDFGLARRYNLEDEHVTSTRNLRFVGNPAFASCNAHLYRTLSRRDDLESLGYILIYFITGTLPWVCSEMDTVEEQFMYIQRFKLAISIEELCQGLPEEFMQYFQWVRVLRYDEEPNYNYLRAMLRNLGDKNKYIYDDVFDWTQPNTTNA